MLANPLSDVGGAAITHSRSEPPPEKTRWVSSQVIGDSTAQTVTISSIGFMPKALCVEAAYRRIETALAGTEFQNIWKSCL
jgi:hypothetical protein